MKSHKVFICLILLLFICNTVGAVIINPDVLLLANGYTLQTRSAQTYTFVHDNMESDGDYWWNLTEGGNITFVDNVSCNHDFIEQWGWYNIGNYTTVLKIDVYYTPSWTINKFYVRVKDGVGILEQNISSLFSVSYPNSTHKRYTYIYNPSNSIVDTSLGDFDLDIFIDATNNTLHYYGNRSWNNLFEVYELDPPWNGITLFKHIYNSVNMTWSNGNNSDRNVVVRKNSSVNPVSPLDGYEAYNGTNTWFNDTITPGSSQSYSVFSYNATSHSYSSPLDLDWGGLGMSCFNETSGLPIWFNMEITDQYGLETYTAENCENIYYLNLSIIPYGDNTVFTISNTSYKQRVYYYDLVPNIFYNLTFYLPPIYFTPGHDPVNETKLYRLRVIDENTYPVGGAKVTIKRYINATGEYEIQMILITNGYGESDCWLIPEAHYKVYINVDNYIQDPPIPDWWPDPVFYGVNYPKIFQIRSLLQNISEPEGFWDIIHFNATMHNNSIIRVFYEDTEERTINAAFYIYEAYNSIYSYFDINSTTDDIFNFTVINVNISRMYRVTLYLNHSTLGYVIVSLAVGPLISPKYNTTEIEEIMKDAGGDFDLGWVNTFFIYLPMLIFLVLPGKGHPGIGIIASMLYAGAATYYISIPAGLISFIPLGIAIGLILIFVKSGRLKL